ncbi:MAG: dephospho-CoA kinase [Candidatus Omnitrophica bacterium]|nr:dephospho-CoA kinase [Candidatus Omnitrophota bacterium]
MKKTIIVGLTGSFGTGKSTIASMFKDCGACVIDTDHIAHELLEWDGDCYHSVVSVFGPGILNGQTISRSKLATEVFDDSEKLKCLESIIHPAVERKMLEAIKGCGNDEKAQIIVVEVPLLFEAGYDRHMDVIVVASSSLAQQHSRIAEHRRMSKDEVNKRIQAQWSLTDKINRADYVIDNSKNLTNTKKEVMKVWTKLAEEQEL